MKLSTCFIFLFLICILFDLNYCRKSNKDKGGKLKNQETTKYAASRICKNFFERGIISPKGEKIILTENNSERYKRSTRRESKIKKNMFEKLCCCGGLMFI